MDFYPAFLQQGAAGMGLGLWAGQGLPIPMPCPVLSPSRVWGARLPQIFPVNKSNPQNQQEFLIWKTKGALVTCRVGEAGAGG